MKSIVETSQEMPTTLHPDNSKGNTIKDFSFQVYPALKLKQTLACLIEEQFNSHGFGMIEVGEVGLEITMGNSNNSTVAHLWLKPTGLIDFQCTKPMIAEFVNLKNIYHNLVNADDKDTISIHHLHGSNQLFFSFGSDPSTQFSEEFVEQDEVYHVKFPNITYACEAVILSNHLKQMIEKYEAAIDPKLVSVDISKDYLKIAVGETDWLYSYRHGDKLNGIRGMVGDEEHHAWFQWRDCEFLKKAALVAPGVLLCFTTDPPHCIMLRFNLRELGDLVYLQKSALTVFNSHSSQELKAGLGHLPTTASLV
ncbi:hypothetical protein KSS87_011652 [Heliosperma pusillum]|nr:hypothetical protein KSS87_011652 [Heliosperma pusillum]